MITAGDGKTCLEKAKRYTPDLIVLDMALPLMNGNQICELLKADESTSDIPIIFISSKPSIETDLTSLPQFVRSHSDSVKATNIKSSIVQSTIVLKTCTL